MGIFLFFVYQCTGYYASTFFAIYLASAWFEEDSKCLLKFIWFAIIIAIMLIAQKTYSTLQVKKSTIFITGTFLCGFFTFLTSIGANYKVFSFLAISILGFNLVFYTTVGCLSWIIFVETTEVELIHIPLFIMWILYLGIFQISPYVSNYMGIDIMFGAFGIISILCGGISSFIFKNT